LVAPLPPPKPPNPVLQVWPPVEVIRTVRAVTAPVESADPTAVTQSPTARELAAVDAVSLYVVDAFTPTVTLLLLIDVGGVDVDELPPDLVNMEEEMP
jgi:hypothetical protein